MTETKSVPDLAMLLDELRCTDSDIFFGAGKRSYAQLERIFVNANTFVVLVHSIDWGSCPVAEAAELREQILCNANFIRECALKAFTSWNLEHSEKELVWSKYVDSFEALALVFAPIDKGLSERLESAI